MNLAKNSAVRTIWNIRYMVRGWNRRLACWHLWSSKTQKSSRTFWICLEDYKINNNDVPWSLSQPRCWKSSKVHRAYLDPYDSPLHFNFPHWSSADRYHAAEMTALQPVTIGCLAGYFEDLELSTVLGTEDLQWRKLLVTKSLVQYNSIPNSSTPLGHFFIRIRNRLYDIPQCSLIIDKARSISLRLGASKLNAGHRLDAWSTKVHPLVTYEDHSTPISEAWGCGLAGNGGMTRRLANG